MAVSKNTIVITSKGPKGDKGAAVTVDGDAITSFSTIAVTGDTDIVADQANDTVTFTGGTNVTVSSSGSEVTIASDNTTYTLPTAQSGSNATITLTGSDSSTDVVTLAAGSGVTLTATSDTITIASTGGGGGGGLDNVVEDTTPELGGDLDVGTFDIVSSSNRNININPNGTGQVVLDGFTYPNTGGGADKILKLASDGTTLEFVDRPNSFGTIRANVSGTPVVADQHNDEVTFVSAADSTITIGASSLSNIITFSGGNLSDDSSPQLTANLDVNNFGITTTTSNGSVFVYPNGTGFVSLGSNASNDNVNISPGLIEVRNDNTQSEIRLYCENDTHYAALKAPAHADISASYTLTLPGDDGTANQYLKTDGSGNLSWATVSAGSATTLDGQKLEYVVRDTALSSAGHYEGLVMKVGDAGNTLTAGTVYYFNATQTDWVAASNAAEGTAKGILGIALGTSGTTDGVLIQGVYYYANAAGATGDVLFLGTAGALTATAPTSDGEILRVLGQNIDDNIVMFNPSQDFVELGAAAGTTGLNDLSDVTITGTPAAGEILINNATSGDFENATLTEGASVVITNADASITIDACQGQELQVVTRDSTDGAVSAAGEAEGTIVKFGTGTLAAGKVYTHASGAWVAVDGNSDTTTEGLLGMALGQSPTSDGLLVHGVGYLDHDPGQAGDVLYVGVGATAGQLTATQPTAGGDFVRVAGYCLADNKIFFSPSQDYIEIAT